MFILVLLLLSLFQPGIIFPYILHSEELEISTTAHMQSNISTVKKTPGNISYGSLTLLEDKIKHIEIFKSLRKK